MTDTPNLQDDLLQPVDIASLTPTERSTHAPRILIL